MRPCFWIPAVLAAAVFAAAAPHARALDWLPVTEADRAASASKIDPEAGAEILYRMEQIDNGGTEGAMIEEYVRIKVFNEKGVRRVSKMQVYYDEHEVISWLDARVIKPNGAIINVDKKSFFDSKVVKFGDSPVQARAFTFPQLAPGDIVEYQAGRASVGVYRNAHLYFQSDLPSRHVVFRIRPAPPASGYRTTAFYNRVPPRDPRLSPDGFNVVEMRDVPAYAIEPRSPPRNDAQSWMLFYATTMAGKADAYWKEAGTAAAAEAERLIKKSSQLVREKAASLTAGVTGAEEKLARLNDYCRSSILNASHFPTPGDVDRKKLLASRRTPDELIQSGIGSSRDTPVLLVALARALGLDARIALCASWDDGAFRKGIQKPENLPDMLVAARVGDDWKFYDPARCRVTTGTLHWQNEGNGALVASRGGVEWAVLPLTPAGQSQRKRTARLRVDEEGTLTGAISIEYSGQALNTARHDFHKKPAKAVGNLVGGREKARMPSSKVSKAKAAAANDLARPITLTYEITVPGYAEKAGSRLFIQPSFFEKGGKNEFPDEKRVNDVFFRTNVRDVDEVTISVPAGYQIEEGSAPVSKTENDWGTWGHYKVSLGVRKSDSTIVYKRDFVFNAKVVAADKYFVVKEIFGHVFAQDAHMITLRAPARPARDETARPPAPAPAAATATDEPAQDEPAQDEPAQEEPPPNDQ